MESEKSLEMFQKEPSLFTDYHEGYRQQVEKWPKNPLDIFIKELKKESYRTKIIGDFGCGEAKLH